MIIQYQLKMGCFGVSKSKAAYIAEPNFGKKAQLMMTAAQKKEKKTGCFGGRLKYLKKAVKSYDTYNRCMAVHLFRETDHRNVHQMISVCLNACPVQDVARREFSRNAAKASRGENPTSSLDRAGA